MINQTIKSNKQYQPNDSYWAGLSATGSTVPGKNVLEIHWPSGPKRRQKKPMEPINWEIKNKIPLTHCGIINFRKKIHFCYAMNFNRTFVIFIAQNRTQNQSVNLSLLSLLG